MIQFKAKIDLFHCPSMCFKSNGALQSTLQLLMHVHVDVKYNNM